MYFLRFVNISFFLPTPHKRDRSPDRVNRVSFLYSVPPRPLSPTSPCLDLSVPYWRTSQFLKAGGAFELGCTVVPFAEAFLTSKRGVAHSWDIQTTTGTGLHSCVFICCVTKNAVSIKCHHCSRKRFSRCQPHSLMTSDVIYVALCHVMNLIKSKRVIMNSVILIWGHFVRIWQQTSSALFVHANKFELKLIKYSSRL